MAGNRKLWKINEYTTKIFKKYDGIKRKDSISNDNGPFI